MRKVYFTITGTNHYYGQEFLRRGDKVKLIKEPDNQYDREAIRVETEGLGKIGYVANSPYTVKGESVSAGRLYDLFKKKAKGKVMMRLPNGVLCKLIIKNKPARKLDQGQ
ncbi:MAG: HIRAN domain-containing protein [Lachnospiraceae bacterium]|nr:HIRAN domain-containing protein [Lachnospiraceae bacterium]